jgi:hypothetical protein
MNIPATRRRAQGPERAAAWSPCVLVQERALELFSSVAESSHAPGRIFFASGAL